MFLNSLHGHLFWPIFSSTLVVWHAELCLLLFPRVFTMRISIYKSNREPQILTRKREILNFKNHILKVEFNQ